MSLVFDKGKYKYYNEIDQYKNKNNINNNANLSKNNQKKNSGKNNHNEYETSSPFRNINNNKKNNFLTTYQNYSSITNNREQNHNHKKIINAKKLKYNKSFEGNMIDNDLVFPNNFDFTNDDVYSNHHPKNPGNKKFNNSVILNNKPPKTKYKNNNKSVTRTINSHNNMNSKKNNLDENFIIKKLDEKFKSLENNIIDKKYENDIDHDEMIISTNKKNSNYQNLNNKVKTAIKNSDRNYNLSNIIDDVNFNNKIDYNKDDKIEHLFIDMLNNKNKIDIDENYLLNSSFENNRNDFNIMYTDDYGETVFDDMLSLEIKLLIEKMIELQKSYHKELNLIIKQYNNNKRIFNILIEKIKTLEKKKYLINKLQETGNIKGNIYNFIGKYNHNNQKEINNINKNEFLLWNNIMKSKVNNERNQEKIKELFKKTIFDKYNKISGKINNIENKIILNLMKKYKYKKNDGIKPRGSNDNTNYNYDNNKIYTASPIQQYKNMIKQNRKNNNSSTVNKKKTHKKTTSFCPAKPSKYIYFKNSKQNK